MVGRIIDCDVHPLVHGGLGALFPYLDQGWRKRMEPRQHLDPFYGGRTPSHLAGGTNRVDATPPSGALAGSDPAFVGQQLLAANGIELAVLLPFQPARLCMWGDTDEAITLASAYNSYFVDHWLEADERYRLAIVVAPQDPVAAAAEVRRHATTRGVVGVWVPPFHFGFGFRYYDPIYEAAQESGMTIVFHVAADSAGGPPAAGHASVHSSSCEGYASIPATGMKELSNLIFEGALSRFPELKFVFVEYGFTWVPPSLWRMDSSWKTARVGTPWVAKPPSEYVMERVRFTSEPAVEVPTTPLLRSVLEAMHAERTLLFSSDYPHWDSDLPSGVFAGIDQGLRDRIFCENAIETFGERLQAQLEPVAR